MQPPPSGHTGTVLVLGVPVGPVARKPGWHSCALSRELRGQHSLPSMARDTPHLDNEGPGSWPPELLAWPTDVAWTCQATCGKAEWALGGADGLPAAQWEQVWGRAAVLRMGRPTSHL